MLSTNEKVFFINKKRIYKYKDNRSGSHSDSVSVPGSVVCKIVGKA